MSKSTCPIWTPHLAPRTPQLPESAPLPASSVGHSHHCAAQPPRIGGMPATSHQRQPKPPLALPGVPVSPDTSKGLEWHLRPAGLPIVNTRPCRRDRMPPNCMKHPGQTPAPSRATRATEWHTRPHNATARRYPPTERKRLGGIESTSRMAHYKH